MKKSINRIHSILALFLSFCLASQLASATGPVNGDPQSVTDETQAANAAIQAAAESQTSDAATPAAAQKKPTLFRELWEDEKDIWTAPFRIKGRHILVTGGILASAGLLVLVDEDIAESVIQYHDRHRWLHVFSKNYTQLGGAEAWGIAGLFLIEGLLAGDNRARDTGIMGIEAMLHSGLVAQVGKLLASRQRPYVEDGRDHWLFLSGIGKHFAANAISDFTSFPSGHTTVTFSLATVIALQYRDKGWVPPACYTLAALVGLTRLVEYKHWMSDVVIGAALGYAVGKMVVRNHRRRRAAMPVLNVSKGGISIGLNF